MNNEHLTMKQLSTFIPKWYAEMLDHYQKTGCYRREDIEKMFGSPMDRTSIKPKTDSKNPIFLDKTFHKK